MVSMNGGVFCLFFYCLYATKMLVSNNRVPGSGIISCKALPRFVCFGTHSDTPLPQKSPAKNLSAYEKIHYFTIFNN